jgi:hypothetical protein
MVRQGSAMRLRERKFQEIGLDNFNAILTVIQPRVKFSVASSLSSDQLEIDLQFQHIDDFEPRNILRRVEPLRELSERTPSAESQHLVWRHLDLFGLCSTDYGVPLEFSSAFSMVHGLYTKCRLTVADPPGLIRRPGK